jgi:aspartate aminotransferase
VNAAAQYAGLAALQGPQDAVYAMVAQFDKRREIIVRELNALPGFRCADAAGAFYAFPNIEGTGMTSKEAQNRFLEEAGVATVSGTSFGAWGEGYVRFSYANSAENILEAMRRIRGLL